MKLPIAILVGAGLLGGCIREVAPDASPAGTTSKPSAAVVNQPKGVNPPTSRPTVGSGKVDSNVAAAGARLDEQVYDHYGAGVAEGDAAIGLADLVANAKDHTGKQVRLTGKIDSVCKAKGCWMILADGPHQVRITFRDYGFFMPKDCEGRTAILDGRFEVKEVPVAEVKHYLEDAGRHDEAAKVTEPRQEFRVVADGVALRKRG
jgi:hypothetical protein